MQGETQKQKCQLQPESISPSAEFFKLITTNDIELQHLVG
jgi:hypothetical protein